MLDPAINGSISILESISTCAPTVKRVVITASIASIVNIPKGNWPGKVYTEQDWNPLTLEESLSNPLLGYVGSKPDTGPIKELMESTFPDLRNAHFGQAHWGWKQGPVNLLGGDTGRLEEFRIKSIPVQCQIDRTMQCHRDITELTLNVPYVSSEVLKRLSKRVISGNRVEWRSSRLEKLSIPFAGLKDFREVAKNRYGGSNGNGSVTEEGDLAIYWPDDLVFLDFSGLSDDENRRRRGEVLGCYEVTGYNQRKRERLLDD